MSQAVYMISSSSSLSFPKEHLSIFAGIKVKGSQAIVDTAAEDAVIGTEALKALQLELAQHGLQVLKVETERQVPCAGIGGEATAAGVVDVPTSIAGLHGVLRFSVLNDTVQFQTPPLLPISYLEAVGALLDFKNDRYNTADGYSAAMVRLPSGHRVIDILNFDRPWALPSKFLDENGDPFRLPEPSPSIEQNFGPSGVPDGEVASSMLSPKASSMTTSVSMPTSSMTTSVSMPTTVIQAASTASPGKLDAMSLKQAPASESVEFMAQHFLSREDFTFEALEVLIDLLPRSSSKTTRAVTQSEREDSKRFVGGAYVHGGVAGITQFSHLSPSFCKYMNNWAFRHLPEGSESAQSGWTSFQVSYGFKAKVHKDSHNAGKNLITAVGSFTGGELWLAGDCGDNGLPRVKKVGSQWISGKAIDIKHKVFEFSPKSLHATLPWKGSRKSVTFYTIRDSFRLSAQHWQLLEDLQFPVQYMPKPTFFQLCDDPSSDDQDRIDTSSRASWPIANMLKHLSSWILKSRSRPTPINRHHGLLAESHQPDGGVRVPRDEATRRMGTQRNLAAWKRLVRTLLFMLATARQQMMLDYIVKREDEPANQPSSSTTPVKKKKDKNLPVNQGLGRPLPRSKAQAKFCREPEECNHRSDALRCRANSKATWWTCLDCGSRWQRPAEDPKTTRSTTFEVDEKAAKIKNRQGQEFPRYLPAPRGRLQQGYRQVEVDPTGKPKTITQPHQQTEETASSPPKPTRTEAQLPPSATARSPTLAAVDSRGGTASSPTTSRIRQTSSGLREIQRSKTPARRAVSVNSVKSVETWEINTDDETVDADMPQHPNVKHEQ